MGRVVLSGVAKCSQMDNPTAGSGTGGDRCTEACGAIIVETMGISPLAGTKHTAEDTMYYFTRMLNHGSNVSALESAAWIDSWLRDKSKNKVFLSNIHGPSFQDIVKMIDAGQIGIAGFNMYENLRLYNGQNPYKWTDHGAIGHVIIVIGYDSTRQTVIVHDPLRADPSGQPADYRWDSFLNAQFSDLSAVHGKALSGGGVGGGVKKVLDPLTPDSSITQFCAQLDNIEMLNDPFTPTVNGGFSDYVSAVLDTFWHDMIALLFRGLLMAVGMFLLFQVINSWIHREAAPVAQEAGQVAMMAG